MNIIPTSIKNRFLKALAEKIKNIPMFLQPWAYASEITNPNDFAGLTKEFRSWVYICATKNAASVAALPIKLYAYKTSGKQKYAVKTCKVSKETKKYLRKQPHLASIMTKAVDFEEVLEHPLLDLFKSVNPFMSRFQLWEQTELWQEMTGNAYWYLASAGKSSETTQPDQIWILPANQMKIVPDKDNFIKGYVYINGSEKIPYEPYEIIHFKFPSLESPYYGMSPCAAVAFAVGINNDINKFERTLMQNQARPEGVLTTEQGLDDDEFERLKQQWKDNYGGAGKVGKTVILERGLNYVPITFSPRDLQYMQGRKWNREEILAAYGVPMSKVTSENINLANAYVGERQYGMDTIQPRVIRMEEILNEDSFIGRYGTNMFVAFENPVPEDKEFTLRERESNLKCQLTSVNEERKKLGMEEAEWGNMPLVGGGIAPLNLTPPDQSGDSGYDPYGDMFGGKQLTSEKRFIVMMKELEDKLAERFVDEYRNQKNSRVIPIGKRKALTGSD